MYSNQKLLIAITALIFTTTAIQAFSKETERHLAIDPPETVDYVDIDRYLGRWYQQAVIPDFFERNCVNTQTFYSRINSTTIQVDNTCQRDGRKVESLGNATIEDASNSKLNVVFKNVIKFSAQYWIVKLGDAQNYGFSVISTPNYHYLAIASRNERMDDATYNSIIEWLRSKGGYQVDKLVRTKK